MAYNQNNSQRNHNDEVYFDLMEHIGVLGKKDNGWTKEVNIVSWNGGKPKVDIRDWGPGRERMARGITLFDNEAENLVRALAGRYGFRLACAAPAGSAPAEAAPAAPPAPDETSAGQTSPDDSRY